MRVLPPPTGKPRGRIEYGFVRATALPLTVKSTKLMTMLKLPETPSLETFLTLPDGCREIGPPTQRELDCEVDSPFYAGLRRNESTATDTTAIAPFTIEFNSTRHKGTYAE